MAPFISSPWVFNIYVGDPVRAAALAAAFPNGIQNAPVAVGAALGIPVNIGYPAPPASYIIANGYPSVNTWTSSPPFGPYAPQTSLPGQALTPNVASAVVVPAFTDMNGLQQPANVLYWVGYIAPAPGPVTPAPPVPPPIGVRRFAIGFETPLQGELAISTPKQARAASRSLDGYGYAYRATAINDGSIVSLPANVRSGWERIYIRLRALPSNLDQIWAITGSGDGHPTLHLSVTAGGGLALYNRGNNSYPGTLLGTSGALALNTWHRVDLNIAFPPVNPPGGGTVAFYLDGAQVGNFVVARGQLGLGTPQTWVNSSIGNNDGGTPTNGLEADLDDWINSDFLNVAIGSHCQLVRASGFAPGHNPVWIGDWRALLAQFAESSLAVNAVTTQIASAQMEVTSDFSTIPSPSVASVSLSIFDRAVTGGGNGQLGYRGPSGPVLQTVALGAGAWSRALITAPGTAYINLGSFNLLFIKDPSGAAGNAYGATSLMASVELAGAFGPEDVPPGSTVQVLSLTRRGIHNSPFPYASWSLSPIGTITDVAVNYGTYVGNGTGQDVLTVIAPHWFWVRAVGGNADGVWWFSTLDTAHGYADQLMTPDRMFRAMIDTNGNGVMRIAGQDVQANSNGVTYQWVAFSDPGQRFMLNGALRHRTTLASVLNALIDPAFTPDGAFFFNEAPSTGGGSNSWFKGIGHTLDSASPIDAAVNNTVASVGAGALTSKAAIHNAQGTQFQTAFSMLRRVDAGGISGALDLVTYVGNGAGGVRNIAVNLNGIAPGFAIVTPHTGASYFRDPSHAGTASNQIGVGLVANNAIVGFAPNQVQVGPTLNVNGTVYDIFVLPLTIGPRSVPPGLGFGPVGPAQGLTPLPPPGPTPTNPPARGACYPLSQALADLGARLGDPNHIHWTTAELTRYIAEALRTYNAYTHNYRNRATFTPTVFQPFFDLPTVIPSLRAYNISDRDLITDAQYNLMEPPTPTAWTGTVQFDLATVAACLQKRRDQFLKETGAVLTREVVSTAPPVSGRIPLPIDVLALRRVAWGTVAAVYTPLKRDDEWSLTAYKRSWAANPADPKDVYPTVYSTGVTPPLVSQLGPVPLTAGFIDILAAVLGNAFTPNLNASLVGVPDDWAWVVKWGALADLLSQDGLAKDPQRAAYCEARWEQGIALATQATVVLEGYINGVPARINSVNDTDTYKRTWQTVPGPPSQLLIAGHNVLGVSPPPNAASAAAVITLDVVANMPVPVALTDCLNTGIDLAELDIIYDYVEHLALFKEGPGQLTAAMGLLDRFLRACGVTVALDMASTPDRKAIFGQTTQDNKVHFRSVPDPIESPPSGGQS